MPDDTSIRVSERLADELWDRKQRGDSYEDVIWRLIETADSDSAESPAERGAERPPGAAREPAGTIPGQTEATDDSGERGETADSVPTAGAGDPDGVERVRAVARDHLEEEYSTWPPERVDAGAEAAVASYQYLTERNGASMREFVARVATEHPAGYDIDPPAEGERYRGAWWRKVVRPVLRELPDVEEPSGGGEWEYVGE